MFSILKIVTFLNLNHLATYKVT